VGVTVRQCVLTEVSSYVTAMHVESVVTSGPTGVTTTRLDRNMYIIIIVIIIISQLHELIHGHFWHTHRIFNFILLLICVGAFVSRGSIGPAEPLLRTRPLHIWPPLISL